MFCESWDELENYFMGVGVVGTLNWFKIWRGWVDPSQINPIHTKIWRELSMELSQNRVIRRVYVQRRICLFCMINERSKFFRGLSEKIWVWAAQPGLWPRFWKAYISETVNPILTRFSQGIGSFKLPWSQSDWTHLGGGGTLAGSACRMKGVKIGR